jgi:hypothetical protein
MHAEHRFCTINESSRYMEKIVHREREREREEKMKMGFCDWKKSIKISKSKGIFILGGVYVYASF